MPWNGCGCPATPCSLSAAPSRCSICACWRCSTPIHGVPRRPYRRGFLPRIGRLDAGPLICLYEGVNPDRNGWAMAAKPEVVLVHGAWHGSWCWEPLRERLEARGIRTHAPDLQSAGEQARGLTDFYADAAAVRRLTDSIEAPVVLSGHSYGGLVVTEASAGSANVKHLVMIATIMFDAGEVWKEIRMPSREWIKPEGGEALAILDKP